MAVVAAARAIDGVAAHLNAMRLFFAPAQFATRCGRPFTCHFCPSASASGRHKLARWLKSEVYIHDLRANFSDYNTRFYFARAQSLRSIRVMTRV